MDLKKVLEELIDEMSSIGGQESGGITRLLYTKDWLDAQKTLFKKIEDSGMQARFDSIGNLYGKLEGSKYPNETIMTGSHIDTVVQGGRLDGQYGVVAGFLALKYLKEKYGQPLRSLELISMAEEEGSRFPMAFWGSKNFVGEQNNEEVLEMEDFNGKKFMDEMRNCGFELNTNFVKRDDIKGFVEIHVEQGNVLENEELQIGVVTAIAGQRRYTVVLEGVANHAGTTPMGYRKDAVYAFSRICSVITDRAKKVGDPLVVTFGKVEVTPNTVNVVPGSILFTIDCRHPEQKELDAFTIELEKYIEEVSEEMGIGCSIDLWMDESPVPMCNKIQNTIEKVVKERGITYKKMHSGAGHDSQVIAPHYNTGMIFVPSIKGISHNPEEKTKIEDLVVGLEVLAETLYELAYVE